MRLARTLVVTSLAALVLALAAAPAGAQSTPTLVDVRAGSHAGFDRVVFQFRGAVPEHRVQYVAQLGDFEAVVSYGIGVDQRRPIEVSTRSNPSRLVIDIATTGAGGSAGDDSGSLPFTGPRTTESWSPGSPSWPPGRRCWPWPAGPASRKASPGDRGPPAATRDSRSGHRAAASPCVPGRIGRKPFKPLANCDSVPGR
jgi:hypothetical protein